MKSIGKLCFLAWLGFAAYHYVFEGDSQTLPETEPRPVARYVKHYARAGDSPRIRDFIAKIEATEAASFAKQEVIDRVRDYGKSSSRDQARDWAKEATDNFIDRYAGGSRELKDAAHHLIDGKVVDAAIDSVAPSETSNEADRAECRSAADDFLYWHERSSGWNNPTIPRWRLDRT